MVSGGGNDVNFSKLLAHCFGGFSGNCVNDFMKKTEKKATKDNRKKYGSCGKKDCVWKNVKKRYTSFTDRLLGVPVKNIQKLDKYKGPKMFGLKTYLDRLKKDFRITYEDKDRQSLVFLREYPTLSYKGGRGKNKFTPCHKHDDDPRHYRNMEKEVEVGFLDVDQSDGEPKRPILPCMQISSNERRSWKKRVGRPSQAGS